MLSNGFDLNEFHPISMMRYMQSQYSEDKKIVQKQNKNNLMILIFFLWRTPFENEQSSCTWKLKNYWAFFRF